MSKKYLRKLMKQLRCSRHRRKEIIGQLALELEARVEQGETEEAVLAQMGAPGEIAKEFNATFSIEEKRKYRREKWGRIAAVIVGILLILGIGIYWVLPKTYDIGESKIFDKEAVRQQLEQVVSFVEEEDYEALKNCSDEQMKAFFSGNDLKEAKQLFGDEWGERQAFGNMYIAEVHQMGEANAVAQFNTSYENVSVTYTLIFDEDMRLTGLWMK
ncbi:DUF3887 domain-containing protein [Roseburia hominis]